ncbi:MAG TPA: HD domain-containing protein, partial [Devosia sp.]|nr:HD domain-containing protein [Devosia sp.]
MSAIKSAAELVAEARAEIETLTVESAHALFGQRDVLFVDIRDVRELEREGIIPGALHAPRGLLEFWVDPESIYHRKEFSSGKKLVLFCAAGWRSALAAKALQDMGLNNVCDMEGGFDAWKKSGGATGGQGKKPGPDSRASDIVQTLSQLGHKSRLAEQIAFVLEIDKLKQVFRQTPLIDYSRKENDAEHSWQLAMMALVLSEYAPPEIEHMRVLKMVLIHDIVEIDAG